MTNLPGLEIHCADNVTFFYYHLIAFVFSFRNSSQQLKISNYPAVFTWYENEPCQPLPSCPLFRLFHSFLPSLICLLWNEAFYWKNEIPKSPHCLVELNTKGYNETWLNILNLTRSRSWSRKFVFVLSNLSKLSCLIWSQDAQKVIWIQFNGSSV